MQKPRWVSVAGWLALICVVTPFGIPLAESLGRVRIPVTVVPGLMLVAFVPLAALWFVGSIIHRMRMYSARLVASALDAQKRQTVPPMPQTLPR